MTYGVVDLFCGVGGLTCGLEEAGLDVVAGYDLDASCEYTYTHNTENELYSSNSALGKYNNDDKLIGINHIRLSNVKLDDTQIVTQIEQNKKKLQKLQKSL